MHQAASGQSPPGQGRIGALDGLRGLASVVVVIRHISNAVEMPFLSRWALLKSPLALLLNAQGAVQIFFVLSGYVLCASLARNRHWGDMIQFFVKRAFRIHPPFVFAVFFSWLISFAFLVSDTGEGTTGWIERSARIHLTPRQLFESMTFPGSAMGLVPHGWTLTVEMIFSLLLPLMVWVATRIHWSMLLILSALTLMLGPISTLLWYSVDFSIGVALFLERDRIGRFFSAAPTIALPLLCATALALWSAPMLLGWFTANPQLGILIGGGDPASIWISGIGSAGLVITAIFAPWARRFLSSRPLAWLGKISFSLYLLHRVFITLFAPYLGTGFRWLDAVLLYALVFGVALPLSALAHRYVERPSIQIGNWVCRRIASFTHTRSLESHAGDAATRPELGNGD